jgi:acyl transferase domain-containing protein/SAM-dependent methyltransferase
MIRQAYRAANITDFSKTAFVECHGTGTPIGDPIEANAVARVFGDSGVYIGSVKPNLGHSEGASGLTSLMKAVLSLQNRTIPPNIKFSSPNPNIPFLDSRLVVPLEPVPWPESRLERVSVNSFGIGGTNAHVVLDSARSFNVFSPSTGPCSANPQLLLLSANSAASLNNVILNFQDWVSKAADNLEDLAYTLANKREHLSHRAFMVAGKDRPSVVSQGRRTTGPPPDLVFVFTGQGAQWPRMGRELLLRSDLIFQSRIRSLDKYLQGAVGAPQWTLEEELLKSGMASGVEMAELSQPLCTAVQIALVDLFAAAGVEPSAVVGHSSGEIAAAYATGALTAREAIFAAWQRGIAAKKQTKSGAMAAVGLGWDEVKPFLVTDVVVACENSSRSVTLSGDTSKIQETVLSIKKSYPDVMARLLKVDKAYHSYHMREVGQDYCSEMKRHLVGKRPQKPFFSSVTGKQINEPLDAAYWQKNLESPVLFNSAVSGILGSFKNVAFLEIGPHGALAGPLRQILTHASASAPYVSAMTRGEDCVESFLTAVGKLFELTISVDFKSLMPTGRCLSDLPHYPWDHDSDYWRESRISHEWRYREFASHPLLGIRQLESTSLEPSWRNILYVDNVSWLRDHKIEGNIIFPCAGYIAMAGEAIRQITGSDVTFTVRNMVLSSAMLLTERNPAEMVTTFRPYRLTDLLNSKAWEFSIASHNGHVWTRHCTGQVTSEAIEPTPVPCTTTLPRKVERRRYYRALTQAGVGLGPRFQRFADIRTSTAQHLATVKLRSDVNEDDDRYYLHPTIVDACIQSAALAATNGRVDVKYYRRIPTKVDRVTVRRCASNSDMMVLASATFSKSSGDVVGRVSCIAHGKTVVEMEGAKLSPLEEAEAEEADNLHITARLEWGPHIDFLNAADLIKPSYPRELYSPSLDEMVRLCFVYSDRRIERNQASSTHMQKYQAWIKRQVLLMGEDSPMRAFEDTAILDKVDSFVRQLSDSPVAACAATVQKVVSNIDGLFSGKIDGLEMLLADDTLTQVLATDACDKSQFIRHLAHSKPNLRILEIGAGTGASTASMLKDLALPTGQPLYSKYTFTDISSAFFVSAKDHFKSHRNIEYRILDITRDPVEQGFEVTEKYDLIIATNVIHATKSLGESLRNVHKLLDPNGRLLLHELNSPSKLPNFIFGLLPGWWYGESDGRAQEPYVDPARWQSELTSAGFGGLDAVVLDGEEPHQLNAIMVAKPQVGLTKKKAVTLLCDVNQEHAGSLSRNLESRGYTVNQCRLDDELPESQDVISLLDSSHAIFENINVCRYEAFQQMLNGLGGGSGILWITHACQVQCEDPSYAQIIGVARTIRTEMLLDFATCEVDDIGTSPDRIVDVFARFQERREDDALKADFEYAITKGTVNVGRIYPFSLKDELLLETTPEDQVVLDLAKPGRLETLQWTPRETKPLSGDEVEIKIYAAGLNFKVR